MCVYVVLVRLSRIASGTRAFNTTPKEIDMNATHRPSARLAELSPFYITVATQQQLRHDRNAVYRECCSARADSDSSYGCVDWYQYGLVGRLQAPQQKTVV
jgi:hypothetical protein